MFTARIGPLSGSLPVSRISSPFSIAHAIVASLRVVATPRPRQRRPTAVMSCQAIVVEPGTNISDAQPATSPVASSTAITKASGGMLSRRTSRAMNSSSGPTATSSSIVGMSW